MIGVPTSGPVRRKASSLSARMRRSHESSSTWASSSAREAERRRRSRPARCRAAAACRRSPRSPSTAAVPEALAVGPVEVADRLVAELGAGRGAEAVVLQAALLGPLHASGKSLPSLMNFSEMKRHPIEMSRQLGDPPDPHRRHARRRDSPGRRRTRCRRDRPGGRARSWAAVSLVAVMGLSPTADRVRLFQTTGRRCAHRRTKRVMIRLTLPGYVPHGDHRARRGAAGTGRLGGRRNPEATLPLLPGSPADRPLACARDIIAGVSRWPPSPSPRSWATRRSPACR